MKFRTYFFHYLTCRIQPELINRSSSIKINISGSFKVKYTSVKRRLSSAKSLENSNDEEKKLVASIDIVDEENSDKSEIIIEVQRNFSFLNRLSLLSDDEFEVTTV